jgi:hypothetical protein
LRYCAIAIGPAADPWLTDSPIDLTEIGVMVLTLRCDVRGMREALSSAGALLHRAEVEKARLLSQLRTAQEEIRRLNIWHAELKARLESRESIKS